MDTYILNFDAVSKDDLAQVGGKNSSLGEMYGKLTSQGIKVPDGFATTARAYWHFIDHNGLREKISQRLTELITSDFSNLHEVGHDIRHMILNSEVPAGLEEAILNAYTALQQRNAGKSQVAVRSSATAEDLPTASFAGQLESYLNVSGKDELIRAFHRCLASLFTDRAIKYRIDNNFDHMKVALSVGVQLMVRSDKASSGVAFTLEPDTGFRDVILINGIWGLGENIVQGKVDPDEYLIFKPTLSQGKKAMISRKLGAKQQTMLFAEAGSEEKVINQDTPQEQRENYTLSEEEVVKLAGWCQKLEEHYGQPMDIEWAKDGDTGEIFIVQARPETVHATRSPHLFSTYHLREKATPIAEGLALGEKIAAGKARILHSPADADKLQDGEVLVTDITNPDWDPIMKKAAAIVTNKGGRTSHAAIVAREIGVVAVVGAGDATEKIKDGDLVTVSCAEGKTGKVYPGQLHWEVQKLDMRDFSLPKTQAMLILGDPDKAFKYSFLPNEGIGLMRLEFIINNAVEVHPMALVKFDELEDQEARQRIEKLTRHYPRKEDYFVEKLAQGVATIAAAFYPREVIVRMSDLKSNEYANLIGGRQFEPHEENPMLGFRGASRYYHDMYREGFRLECEAMTMVRDQMGLTNVKLMIPFCRTVEEGRKVVDLMETYGLQRGKDGLEIYTMVEIPSNVILAEEFAQVFDGFSIGSNDLTQLTLGLDRDSALVSGLFEETNKAVKLMISRVIASARHTRTRIGLCGQAPSDFPEYAEFLVNEGIDSISFNPDALLKGIENIKKAEEEKQNAHAPLDPEMVKLGWNRTNAK